MQRRMSPIARLCGDLALLGDPVVLWNWKRKGPFFTMSSGNIHQSPTVSHNPICTFEPLTYRNNLSLTVSWPFG